MDEASQKAAMPQQTIEAVAKSFYRETYQYGFRRADYLRFVNILLDLGLETSGVYTPPATAAREPAAPDSVEEGERARITVRTYEEEDREILQRWIDDPIGGQFLTTRPEAPLHHDLDSLLADPNNVFGMVALDDNPIGALAFLDVDRTSRKAELRKLIGEPEARGHGYAKIATQVWIEYGLTTLGLRKIYVNTLDTNLANIRLNEELGLRIEGLLRDEIELDGRYHDILRMSLIVPD